MLKEQNRFFSNVLMAADLSIVVAADVLAYVVRFRGLPDLIPPKEAASEIAYGTHAIPVLALLPLTLIGMLSAGLYRPRRDEHFSREAAAVVQGVLVGLALTIAALSLFRNVLFDGRHLSGWQFAVYAAIACCFLVTWRFFFRGFLRVIRAHGWNLRHVAVIGTGRLGQVASQTIERNSWTGIKISYFISHHGATKRQSCLGAPVRGGVHDLDATLDAYPVSGVVIALPGRLIAELPDLLSRLERHPVDVRIVPDTNPRFMPINMTVSELDGMPVLSVRESPLSGGWGRVAKRITDLIGGCAALTLFALPMLVIAILVRRSGPGPVIFRQERMSLNNQRFRIFKFRTMNDVSAEKQALHDAGRGTDAWTAQDDPRITGIGRFLRKTSLDELPQLFNVILGEMSLVGPRPERPELIERFREDWRGYVLRQNVKAGMTGWAQVNGLRGDTSLRKRLQYDMFYIRNWSLTFDLRILWMTIFRGFLHENAG